MIKTIKVTNITDIPRIEDAVPHKGGISDCEYEESEDEEFFSRNKLMRKMSKKEEKEFPMVAADSVICQSYYTARVEKCNGCRFAVDGCEKVFYMSAG